MDKIKKIEDLSYKAMELRRLNLDIMTIESSIKKNRELGEFYNDDDYFDHVYIKQVEKFAPDLLGQEIQIQRKDFITMLESTLKRYKDAYKQLEEEINQTTL